MGHFFIRPKNSARQKKALNNTGSHRNNSLIEITDEELDFMLDVNVKGCVNTLRIAVPYFLERGGSVIINWSDQPRSGEAIILNL